VLKYETCGSLELPIKKWEFVAKQSAFTGELN